MAINNLLPRAFFKHFDKPSLAPQFPRLIYIPFAKGQNEESKREQLKQKERELKENSFHCMVDCTSIQTLLASPSCLLKRGRKTSKFALLNFLQFVYSHFLVFFAFFKSSHCTSFAKLIYFNSAETNSTLLVQKVPKHNLYHIVSLSRHVYIFIWHTKEFFFQKKEFRCGILFNEAN